MVVKGIQVNQQFSNHLPQVEVVEDQIKQVILSFIQNSADSISGEGQITLTTEQQGSQLKIKIQDTGHEDDIENLFDPFFTTKAQQGTGFWVFQLVMVSFGITGRYRSKKRTG